MGCIPIDPKLYSFVILYIINEKKHSQEEHASSLEFPNNIQS